METLTKHSTANNSVLKIIITVLFIVLPFLGFFVGMNYQTSVTESLEVPTTLVRKPTPTPLATTDITNWKTYRNDKYDFELRYPPLFVESSGGQAFEKGDLLSLMIKGATQKDRTELYDGALFTVAAPVTSEKDVDTWSREYFLTHSLGATEPPVYSKKSIENIEFSTVYVCGLGCFNYYFTKKDEYVFGFMTMADGPEKVKYQNLLSQILSTFKFL